MIVFILTIAAMMAMNVTVVVNLGSRFRRTDRSEKRGRRTGQEKKRSAGQMYSICGRWIVAMWLSLSPRTTPPFQTTNAAKDVMRDNCGHRSRRRRGSMDTVAWAREMLVIGKSKNWRQTQVQAERRTCLRGRKVRAMRTFKV